jgi:hypothetical protein
MKRSALVALALVAGCSSSAVTVSPSSSTRPAAPTTVTSVAETTAVPIGPTTTNPDPEYLADPGTTAAQVAQTLIAAEQAIRDPAVPAADAEQAGRRQQLAYRRLGVRPDWIPTVLAAAPAGLRTAIQANLDARTALGTIKGGTTPTSTPAWNILSPEPADVLMRYYKEAERLTRIPWSVLAAINLIESRMGRIQGTSSAGAKGPMQFLPSTWKQCCTGNINNPHDAILGAANYLLKRGGPGNLDKAIFGYNPSAGYVEAVKLYSSVMQTDANAYRGYHAWQVFISSTVGDIRLPVGYRAGDAMDATAYLAAHPIDRAPAIDG